MFGVIVYTERLVLSKRFLFFDVKPFAVTFFRALAETALLVFQHWLSCRQKKQMCCLCCWFFNEAQRSAGMACAAITHNRQTLFLLVKIHIFAFSRSKPCGMGHT